MIKPTSPLLQVQKLAVRFQQGQKIFDAVKNVSFDLHKGQTLALVGESGSGKSVTAMSILKLLPYPMTSHPAGQIWFEDQDILKLSAEDLQHIRGNKIGMIFQEPMTSLNPLHTIEKQIGEVLTLHKGLSGAACRQRIIELLHMVGLTDCGNRLSSFPHQLSGGQRQRVMIAMALAAEPELLIADEPTTALDVTTQAQILSLLKKLQQDLDMTLLLITHDLGIVQAMADHVAVMRHGEIVEQGTTRDIFNNPQHTYTQQLIHSEPRGSAVPFSKSNPIVLTTPGLSVEFPIHKGLWRRQVGAVKAVSGVSLQIQAGETLGIVGESGSGKTTLAMALLRLQTSHGPIIFRGKDISNDDRRALQPIRRQMQVVFQDPFGSLSPRMTINQIVAEGIEVYKLATSPAHLEQQVVEALIKVGLDPETRHRYPHEFSGGQRQRIAIARALVLQPQLIVLDEPTSALDRAVQSDILDLLKELQCQHQLAYLFISHDLKVMRAISHRVMVMYQGQIVESGFTDQIFENPQHPYTQKLMQAALYHKDVETHHDL